MSERDALKTERDALRAERVVWRQDNEYLEGEVANLKAERDALIEDLNYEKSFRADAAKAEGKLREEIARLESTVYRLTAASDAAGKAVIEARAEVERLKAEVAQWEARFDKRIEEVIHDDKQHNAHLEEESRLLAASSTEWLKFALGPQCLSGLWGPALEALGRGVDELRARTLKAEAAAAQLRQAIEEHAECSHECKRCGLSEPCATDDVCLVLETYGGVAQNTDATGGRRASESVREQRLAKPEDAGRSAPAPVAISEDAFAWGRCSHEGIGLPGCPTCDPLQKHWKLRVEAMQRTWLSPEKVVKVREALEAAQTLCRQSSPSYYPKALTEQTAEAVDDAIALLDENGDAPKRPREGAAAEFKATLDIITAEAVITKALALLEAAATRFKGKWTYEIHGAAMVSVHEAIRVLKGATPNPFILCVHDTLKRACAHCGPSTSGADSNRERGTT